MSEPVTAPAQPVYVKPLVTRIAALVVRRDPSGDDTALLAGWRPHDQPALDCLRYRIVGARVEIRHPERYRLHNKILPSRI